MPTYRESGLAINLPEDSSFRLSECSAYQDLKGKSLKEVDFGWWDTTRNTLWLLELEEFEWLKPGERLPEYLFERFMAKATDSLMILSSVWFSSAKGTQFKVSLPSFCHAFPFPPRKIKIVFILKIDRELVQAQIPALRDRLRNRLEGRIALFDMRKSSVILMDHYTAIEMGMPILIAVP